MNLFQKLDRHADLVNRMADTVGVDMGQALLDGRLTGQDLRSMVTSCCACDGAADCPGWMDAHAGGAPSAPDYCNNRDRLGQLRG